MKIIENEAESKMTKKNENKMREWQRMQIMSNHLQKIAIKT